MAITIDGKVYDETKFSVKLRNTIVARQEIEQSKVRHEIELEKIKVLTDYYNNSISEMMKKENVQPEKE
jgi:hypothetical protein